MSIIHSNHPFFQPSEHTFFRNYEKCDGNCDCNFEETELTEWKGYKLCQDCLEEFKEDEEFNRLLLGSFTIADEF